MSAYTSTRKLALISAAGGAVLAIMKYYELWDSETANLIADADTPTEILTLVRDMMREHGALAANTWGLLWADDADEAVGGLIAEGRDLVEMVKSQVPTP